MHRAVRTIAAALLAALAVIADAPDARADRLRDLCDIAGVRDNQLLGYGLVTGLQGTGDDLSSPFAAQSLLALMRRLGVQADPTQLRLRNVAAALVTATLPPFAKPGAKIDVTVSSANNARSLQGGVLVQTLMLGADGHVYAVAQGPLVIGGFEAHGRSGSSVRQNTTNTGRIPEGGFVEREIATTFAKDDSVVLSLHDADFRTAQRIVEAVDKSLGAGSATAIDGASVRVKAPAAMRGKPVELLAKVGDIDVQPASIARVVINERTGTIVAGGDVRLAPVAIAHAGITIVIHEQPVVSQPQPFAAGTTTVVPQSEVSATEANPPFAYLDAASTLSDVAKALTTLGVSPRELASVMQALRSAGALRAEVVVQ